MIRLFTEKPIQEVFNVVGRNILSTLNNYTSFNNVNDVAEATKLTNQYKIDKISVNTDDIDVDIKLESNQRSRYETAVIYYTIKVSGNIELFSATPSIFGTRSIRADINDNRLTFAIASNYANINLPEEKQAQLKSEAKQVINFIKESVEQINGEVDQYNNIMYDEILAEIRKRKVQDDQLNQMKNNLKP